MKTLSNKTKITVMAILLTACVALVYYFHIILHVKVIYTHLFYIPIILGAIWWQRKGIAVAVFLMAIILLSHLYYADVRETIFHDFLRGSMFVVIAVIVSILSEHISRAEVELRETGDYLEKLITHASAPIIVWNPESIITRFNNAFERLTGYEADEVVGRELTILFPEPSEDEVLYKIEQALKGERWESVEIPILCVSGNIRTVLWNSANIHSSDGKDIIATIAQGVDITERNRAEEALRKSKDKYYSLVSSIGDTIYLVDRDCRYLFMNEQHRKRHGLYLYEVTEKTYGDLHSEDQVKTFSEAVERVFETGKSIQNEVLSSVDGRYFLKTLSPVKNESGAVTSVTVVSKDITERRQAEEKVRISEEKYRTILESIEDGYFETDIAGNFTFFNDSTCRILGYSRDELMGMNYKQYTEEGDIKEAYRAYNQVYTTGESTREFAWMIKRKDGSKGFLEASISLMRKKDQPVGFRSVARDITERRQAEEQLRHTLEELKIKDRELREATVQLIQTEKLTALGEMSAGIAHEMNQPLNGISIISQDILRDIEKKRFNAEALGDSLKEVIKQVNRMSGIIDHMRLFTRRSIKGAGETTDVNKAVEGTFMILGQQLQVHNIEVKKDLSSDLPMVTINQIELEQVLINLINNARGAIEKYRKEGGILEIKSSLREVRGKREVLVSIKDNGGGIPENVRDRVFEPFFTTKRPGKGTGLGLSISMKIISEAGGRIELGSEEGNGSTFSIILPVRQEVDSEECTVNR